MLPPVTHLNYLAILVAALVQMVVGALWYSPLLFSKQWSKAVGKTMDEMRGSGTAYVFPAIGALLTAYVMAHIVDYTGAVSLAQGLQTGFWVWLGFTLPAIAVDVVFAGRNKELLYINAGYHLVNMLLAGAILAVWV